jgi:hypothetical protein
METNDRDATPHAPTLGTKPPASPTPQAFPPSPWETYLIGKKTAADAFLAKMGKGAITIPDQQTKDRFAEAIVVKPARLTRLIFLLQACGAAVPTIRNILADLTEATVRRLSVITVPVSLEAAAYEVALTSWLSRVPKTPLKPAELNILFLLLHFGWQRGLLDHRFALTLLSSAVSKPVKPPRKSKPVEPVVLPPAKTPLEALLIAPPARAVLISLVATSQAWSSQSDKLSRQIKSQTAEIERLVAESSVLKAAIAGYKEEIQNLKTQKAAAEGRVADLERQMVEIRDGYQHKLDDLRGRVRGVLQGQLTRWLQTALDAARSDPPWTKAIEERLEDALRLIEKELQWLQPSA